jgi:hypothetical protein
MLPKDPNMLYSYINTQLRDRNLTLEELCAQLGILPEDLCRTLEDAGYEYQEDLKRFV